MRYILFTCDMTGVQEPSIKPPLTFTEIKMDIIKTFTFKIAHN